MKAFHPMRTMNPPDRADNLESTNDERRSMSDLIAIGYPDETTAIAAEQEAQRLAGELVIQPDAIAAIVRHRTASSR